MLLFEPVELVPELDKVRTNHLSLMQSVLTSMEFRLCLFEFCFTEMELGAEIVDHGALLCEFLLVPVRRRALG